MEEIKAPKKERKFLKAMGDIALTLFRELLLGVGKKVINKIGNKRQGLVIAFALVAGISYASIDSIPYPVTGNKQRLGWQTSGNGLVYRGRSNDTITKPSSYVDKNVKAYLLLDSVRGTIFVWRQTYWDSILVGGGGTTFDTSTLNLVNRFAQKVNISDTANMLLPYFKDTDTSILNLQNRFNLKLNISDTAAMLLPYATKLYADTTGRLYARQDFTNVFSSTLTWTQSDTLIPGGVTFVQVYRNGQILLPSQYTIPTSTSIVIAASSFKVGENYTVIFPRGGGAGSGGGSGSLTSISAGTGITVSPNPITTTGEVSADLSVLMELTDTTLLNLTSRFASKLNTTDTASLSNRIDAKGNGTVESVATAYGLTGGTITSTGTLRVDSNTVYNYVRDSIVKVRIGNDTIKILKQEYNNVTSDTLIWTTTVKFPIQLRAYILLFRNGQLLINDQFSIIDTNKIKVAASSYKLGENYTLVTVSGIGSAGVSQTGNPIYPEAGIALSTGTTWATSITNNSSNWNTAFTDRLKWDGSSTGLTPSTGRTSLGGTTIGQNMFTLTNPSAITFPRFNADNTVTALSAALFRSAISAGTVTEVDASATAGNPISINDKTTTPKIELLSATSGRNGYLTSTDWTTFNNKQAALSFTTPLVNTSNTISINQASSSVNGFLTSTDWTTFNSKQNALSNASASVSGILTSTDWTTFNNKQNALSNASSSVSGILTSTDWTTFNNKQNTISLTTNGTSGLATFNGTTLNIPNYTSSGGGTGTVTSVGLTAPSIFNVGGSPVTTSGTLDLTYSGTALPLLNGGTGATTADAALTNLGVSVVGKALLVADNSVSDKFIKVNANKTITLLNAADTRAAIGAGNIEGNGVSNYFAIFGSSSYISQALLRWDGNTVPNSKLISDFNFNDFNGTLSVTGATTLSNLAGTGTRMVVASSTGLLSTQSIGTSVTSFSGGSTGLTPSTATTGAVTLAGTLALGSGGTGATTADGARTNLGATVRGAGTFTLPDISQVSFVRYNANNTVSQRTAEGIRIDLGGTTIGQNMFMLTNPSAITFPRFNADNTVSALSAADFKTAIGVSANANASLFISRTGTSVSFVEDLTSYSVIYLKLNNSSTITVTLPTASLNTNKSITIKNVGTGAVNSNASNVEPLNTTTLSSVLLVSGGGKFTTVVSDGTNWIKMTGN